MISLLLAQSGEAAYTYPSIPSPNHVFIKYYLILNIFKVI